MMDQNDIPELARSVPDSTAGGSQSDKPFQVVLLIHGIRTQAEWQAMVREAVAVPGSIEVIPIKYGYFDVIRFWFPFWTRDKPVTRVESQIRAALQKYGEVDPATKLSIIAHSFGTYIVGRVLQKNFDIRVHRLILCGSVLPSDFPWEQIQGRFDDGMVVNECGKSDIWPVLAQAGSWGYGASGTHGFGSVLVKDRFHAGGHGQYFHRRFVEQYWAPFVRSGQYQPTTFEVDAPPSPWWLSVLGIIPFQWLATFIVITLLTLLAISASNSTGGGRFPFPPAAPTSPYDVVDISPEHDPPPKRDSKVLTFDVEFKHEPFEHVIYNVPSGREFVQTGYSAQGDVEVEFLAVEKSIRWPVERYVTSEGGSFFVGKGRIFRQNTVLVLRSLTGKGRYQLTLRGYLRESADR